MSPDAMNSASISSVETGSTGFEYVDGIDHGLAPPLGSRLRVGLIVLASDSTVEHEWRMIMGPREGVAVYHSRIPFHPTVTAETLKQMEEHLETSASLFLPEIPFDVIAYGCTSASVIIGPEAVRERVRAVRPEVEVTNPFSGALAALAALDARRIAVITPYSRDINEAMHARFEAAGLRVPVMGSFNRFNDNEAARIAPESIEDAAISMGARDDVDAVFVSCTSLRVADIAARAEARIGKPVLSSNLCMAWHTLRIGGYTDPIAGFGRLFER